jgi:hypothetical protein
LNVLLPILNKRTEESGRKKRKLISETLIQDILYAAPTPGVGAIPEQLPVLVMTIPEWRDRFSTTPSIQNVFGLNSGYVPGNTDNPAAEYINGIDWSEFNCASPEVLDTAQAVSDSIHEGFKEIVKQHVAPVTSEFRWWLIFAGDLSGS